MPSLPPVTADVLIVTVTPVESRAVLHAFQQATGNPAKALSLEDRVYRDLGEINGTKVFMALSEMGAGGLGAAQQAVQKGIAALRPQAVIMVGIAFGIDGKKQSIGDILVARQLLLYEAQRVGVGEILPRGDRPHAAPRLVNYLQSAHLEWEGAEVRFGLVLTGEKLVDGLDYRESLKKLEPEAIGGEMEGAGLYVACQDAKVDWILVKAICDWADGHKDQDKAARQQQAAENAAGFVLHALQHAPLNRPHTLDMAPPSTPSPRPSPAEPHLLGEKLESLLGDGKGVRLDSNLLGSILEIEETQRESKNLEYRSPSRNALDELGKTYHATLSGDGAVAHGPDAKAVGAGGVFVGGNNTGNINTGTALNNNELHAQTINVFVGEQGAGLAQAERAAAQKGPKGTLLESIRLDVASPATVFPEVEFDVAVAIRQPSSPPLTIDDLNNYLSSKGVIQRDSKEQIATYRVEIKSANFSIDPARLIFNLEYGCDSEVKWFKLVAKKSGKLSFIVIAYQVDGDIEIASTRVVLESVIEAHPGTDTGKPHKSSAALDLWREKLEYLLQQEAITADPAQRFQLKKAIEEAQQKIRQLGG